MQKNCHFQMSLSGSVIAVLLATGASASSGEDMQHAGHALGTVDFPVSCSQPAQVEFNRAVALLHHMTYPQAREAFQQVTAIDPECAMAHWGIAMTLFQPLWPTRPGPEARHSGWDEVQQARTLKPPTEREQLFVAGAEAFFREPASADYWLRIRRWAQATKRVYELFPDDAEAATFYALGLLATAPTDAISRTNSDQAAEILLRVYARHPDHPGAMHYLVHANDVPGRERKSLEITHKYAAAAPRNPHALHMPTHIYTRVGDWNASIAGNLQSADAALEYPAGDKGQYVWDEFPHAIEYLIYAYLQQGADDKAFAQLQRLRSTARLEPTVKTAFHLASTQTRYALERRAWTEASQLTAREPASLDWDRFPWPEAIVRFGHGLGAAHLGQFDEARRASARLDELEAAARKTGEPLFARNIRVLGLELNAWTAHAQGQKESGVKLMREAADLENSTPKPPVTPGPTLPANELLGDLLMEQKQPSAALASYRRSMRLYPRRFNSVLGAARAARALGESALARGFYQELLGIAGGGTRGPALAEAKNFLSPAAGRSSSQRL
jgi:tetratricopeptide (TPR) repeat protein